MGRRLNISTPTVIQTELSPLNESFYIEQSGQVEQWYYDNTGQYAPNRKITPLTLTPVLEVTEGDTQQTYTPTFNPRWFVSEYDSTTGGYVKREITQTKTNDNANAHDWSSEDYYKEGSNLVVRKNVSYTYGVTIICVVEFIDPRDIGITYETQDSVMLTTNLDAQVVFPEVAITSPSGRTFNPLKDYEVVNGQDVQKSEFDFDGVITNQPDVQPADFKDVARYEMDGYGTEEIISSSNNSCSPIMDIRYPDDTTLTDQEFTFRPTANGTKQGVSGNAFIENIKGHTVKWNQSVPDTVGSTVTNGITFTRNADNSLSIEGTATAYAYNDFGYIYFILGHKYFLSINAKEPQKVNLGAYASAVGIGMAGINAIIVTCQLSGYSNVGVFIQAGTTVNDTLYPQIIDLTLIYGEGNEPATPEEFEADYYKWFGKPLTYEEYDEGSLRSVQMSAIKTTGFNQWDEEYQYGYWNGGTFVPSAAQISSKNFIRVTPNATYYINFNGKGGVVEGFDANKQHVGSVAIWVQGSAIVTIPDNVAYIHFYYNGTTYNNDICINISNPSKNGTYEPYEEHIANIPITSLKGKLNGSGESVTIFADGMKSAGSVHDEVYVSNGKTYAVKRVGSVDLGTLDYSIEGTFGSGAFRAELPNDAHGGNSDVSQRSNIKCSKYKDTSTGGLSGDDKAIAIWGNSITFLVKDTDYSSFTPEQVEDALSGVILYYELETPLVYEVDPIQPFIFEWYGVENGVEVKADTLPWYVSGQNTSKLKVDAMWGEYINVVLRARGVNGLSPSKAFASIKWVIPDIDTNVVSHNGSAIHAGMTGMTFGTVVNVNGSQLAENRKTQHLRFKWITRKNNSTTETNQGWGNEKTIPYNDLKNVIPAGGGTLASTLVFPYVYCLGAWTTNQGTETGYDKPTTTKNGVTYYRIVD